ncbi:MAG: Holliday junction resolvase RuvX [Candidatus Sulfotelmatobacter sp.]
METRRTEKIYGKAGLRPADSRGAAVPTEAPYTRRPGAYNRGVSVEGKKSERPEGRVLGLDVGSRRIGMAVSDPLGITAQGLQTLQRRNKRLDLGALEQVIREYAVREIVVGLPLRMSGAEGTQSEKMQGFAEDLRKRFRLPVHLWDERLSSAEANRLLRETELSIEKRAKAVDRMAAVLILQGWMEGRVVR